MAGAEIVERKAGTQLADLGQQLRRVLRVLHDERLGQLELQSATRERRARDDRTQVVDQIMAQQLPRRHVDAGEDRIARAHAALPGGELARGALQYEQAKIDDQPRFLSDVDELRGRKTT